MPASRNARAITFAPRSWPSSPGFAISTRIFFSGIGFFRFSAPSPFVPGADSLHPASRSARWYRAETEYAENAPTTLPLFQPAKKSIEDRVELFGIIDEQGVPGAFEDFELRSGNLLLHL